jgi:hypothetical protein
VVDRTLAIHNYIIKLTALGKNNNNQLWLIRTTLGTDKLFIASIFMLNINYTQQYTLCKLLIVFIFMLNINYTQQYKVGMLRIVFIFMWNIIIILSSIG